MIKHNTLHYDRLQNTSTSIIQLLYITTLKYITITTLPCSATPHCTAVAIMGLRVLIEVTQEIRANRS